MKHISIELDGILDGGGIKSSNDFTVFEANSGTGIEFCPAHGLCISFRNRIPRENIAYMLPGADFCLSRECGEYELDYGARFPLSFVGLFFERIGITLISENGTDKKFSLRKHGGCIEVSIAFPNGSRFAPRMFICTHYPDFHASLSAYREHYRSLHGAPVTGDFGSAFHIKRYALHSEHFSNNVYNNGRYTLLSEYEKDVSAFGGIDVAQLFDWAYTKKDGRVGSYRPWDELKNTDELRCQLRDISGRGTVTLAYTDAYFVKKGTVLSEQFGEAETIKDSHGEPYYQLGEDHWVICPYTESWQSFLANAAEAAVTRLGFDGVYIDQIGYGTHYRCSDSSHAHSVPSHQNFGEHSLVSRIKSRLGLPIAVEYFPADISLDMCGAALTDNDGYTVISRFVHPHIKQFKVINCDEPIGDNALAVKKAFFNGLGLWLDGDSASDDWYSPRVRSLIKKHYEIMKRFADAFDSDSVIPLIGTAVERVQANLFMGTDTAVFTLFNRGEDAVSADLIPIGELPFGEYRFFDIYGDGGEILPRHTPRGAALPYSIGGGEVGAIGAVKILR